MALLKRNYSFDIEVTAWQDEDIVSLEQDHEIQCEDLVLTNIAFVAEKMAHGYSAVRFKTPFTGTAGRIREDITDGLGVCSFGVDPDRQFTCYSVNQSFGPQTIPKKYDIQLFVKASSLTSGGLYRTSYTDINSTFTGDGGNASGGSADALSALSSTLGSIAYAGTARGGKCARLILKFNAINAVSSF